MFYLSGVDSVVHDRRPTLESRHLEESQVGPTDVVKVDPGVGPDQVVGQAGGLIVDDGRVQDVPLLIDTLHSKEVIGIWVKSLLCRLDIKLHVKLIVGKK